MGKHLPKFSKWFLRRFLLSYSKSSALGDLEEEFELLVQEVGLRRAKHWYRWQVLKSLPSLVHHILFWRITMFRNYITIAMRTLKKHKGYSLINILGLAVGLACCIFILLYVLFELSFDTYHQDVDRIYMVGITSQSDKGREMTIGNMALTIPTLRERYPQVTLAARLNTDRITQVSAGDNVFKEQGLWHADPDIYKILTIPFVQGNPETALERPQTIVLTEEMALKYYGRKNPVGETIKVGDTEFEVTGILQNAPANTDMHYDMIMSWKTIEDDEHYSTWNALVRATHCFIKLKSGVDADAFENQVKELPDEFVGEELAKMGTVYRYFLFPFKDLHLTSFTGGMAKPSTNLIYVYVFSAVGMLILLIACMNFMNLNTARSASRCCEVGMRKVIGAQRRQIIWQFLGESVLIAFIALVVAVGLVLLMMPIFNDLARTQFTASSLVQAKILMGFMGLIFFVGLAAGSYPAFFLSSFKPIAVFRSSLTAGMRGRWMRQILVVGQFGISITLIVATLIVYRQILYMKNRPLGFDKEQKLVITLKSWEMITENYETVKNEFLRHPSVLNATAASGVPGSMINRTWIYPSGEEAEKGRAFRSLRCDHDFLKVYDVELMAGRHFNKEIATDTYSAIIINEAGVKVWGWRSPDEAIGKLLWERRYPIIGVVKDFHWWGLQREIEPLLVRVAPDLFRSISLTVNTTDLQETLGFLEKTYQELFPGDVFEYFFVDTNFDLQYQSEERLVSIFRVFTILGLFIACLGLFGMASFIAEQRTKEIGIRKVLGAPVSRIIVLLTKEFVKWVLIANIVAWPLAYYAGERWLQTFAYRMKMGWELFLVAAVLAFVIAVVTVSYQAMKAAAVNPVDSLRYE